MLDNPKNNAIIGECTVSARYVLRHCTDVNAQCITKQLNGEYMKISIEFDTADATDAELECLIALLKGGEKTPSSLEPVAEDDLGKELTEEEIEDVAVRMNAQAITYFEGKPAFKVVELYKVTTGERWTDLHPKTRKAIGKCFRQIANSYLDSALEEDPVVVFYKRNIQNMALYHVKQKQDVDEV